MNSRLADFYIIGAMKCATSTLHEQLARRARFHMSEPKEPNFFNDEKLVSHGFDDYASLFTLAKPEQITGESSTHYTKIPTYSGTAERILARTPKARFVYVMRHPVDRLISHYIHEWTENEVDTDISRAVLEQERFVAYSSYARQLRPFIERFGKQSILPVFFEHLVTHKEAELERVARFLGDDSTEPFEWHREASQTNVSKDRLRKSKLREGVLSIGVARRIKDALPQDIKERIKSVWRMEKRPELSLEARKQVETRLDADLDELGQQLGLKLSCASFSDVAKSTAPQWADAESAQLIA